MTPQEAGTDSSEPRVYKPPTDEQLESFAKVMFGPHAGSLIRDNPVMKQGALNAHRKMQEDAWKLADEQETP